MNSYLGLVSEYAKVHKKKRRLTIICIAISVMLVVAVIGMADMSVKAQIKSRINESGNWHVRIMDISDDIATQIADRSGINISGWVGVMEDATYEGKTLHVLGGEQDISEQMNLVVSMGNYPVSEQEALLDESALSQFGISIGDTIEVQLSDGEHYRYTITGTYKDFSSLKQNDDHGLFLSIEGLHALNGTEAEEFYYLQFNSGVNISHEISDIKTEYGISDNQVETNNVLLGLMGQSRESSMMQLYLSAAILTILIIIAGTFMISSSFNMSLLERTQFFGLLRCLGATKRQIKRYIRAEGLRYCLVGVPIGLVSGCCIVYLAVFFLNVLNSQYLPEMPLQISWSGVLAGAISGFVTVMLASQSPAKKAASVSPQAAVTGNINNTNNRRIEKAADTRQLHVDTAMGFRHAFSNKKSMVFITGSFAISIILFLCFSILITFMNNALTPLQPYAADISIMGTGDTTLLDRSLLEEIKELPDASKVYGRMFLYDVPAAASQEDNKVTLISYDDPQFEWAEETLIAGNVENVKNGKGIFVCYSEDMNWSLGDIISLNISGEEVDVEIAGILSSMPFAAGDNEWLVICSEHTFTALTGITDYTIIDMQVKSDISEQVRSLLTSEMQMLDYIQSNAEVELIYNAMALFVYGFLIVISLVALINILNTVSASVSNRMNNYGVMRAVGMSNKQLKKMVTAEAAAYAISGSIVGCFCGLLLHRFFFGLMITSTWGEVWHPPFTVLAITIFAALITTCVAVIYPTRKIKEMSIVNVVNAG